MTKAKPKKTPPKHFPDVKIEIDPTLRVKQIVGNAWHLAVLEYLMSRGWVYVLSARTWTYKPITGDKHPADDDLFLLDFLHERYDYGKLWTQLKR